MKSQRRHELQTNTLAQKLEGLPGFWQQHGNKVLIAIIVAALGYFLVRYRMNTAQARLQTSRENLALARNAVNELVGYGFLRFPPEQAAHMRKEAIRNASTAIDTVKAETDEPVLRAEVLATEGDLNWAIAHLAELPGATTQPSLRVDQDRAKCLTSAEQAYQAVLSQYPDQQLSVVTALFGLAAIAEDHSDWASAQSYYQRVGDNPSIRKTYKDMARMRLAVLEQARIPLYIGQPAPPATRPTSMTSTLPSTAPATLPAMPVISLPTALPAPRATTAPISPSTLPASAAPVSPAPAPAPATHSIP